MTALRGSGAIRTRAKGRLSVKAAHVDWLRLVEASGPFLSLKVLADAFPQGLDKPDDEGQVLDDLRLALDGWDAHPGDPAVHQALVRMVVERVLEYGPDAVSAAPAALTEWTRELAEHRVTLSPALVLGVAGGSPAVLVDVTSRGTRLDRSVRDGRLVASPAERMRLLLRETGVRLGVVTNGEKWTLVYVPSGGTPSFATFDLPLMLEERALLRAFRSLLGMRRVIGEADDATLGGLLERSAKDEREVTDALGDQTRRLVEMLVKAIDTADRELSGQVLAGVEPPTLYESAVAVAMRLIFVLSAEARDLLPSDGVWLDSYAVTPMRARLLEERARDTEDVLERRYDAWPRLLATFRAIHDGVEHEAVRLAGHGGGLFDPNRYPFLERSIGRVSNAVVLRMLDDLQTLVVPVSGGTERRPLSFKALGVEQIGHVYERLLGHWAVRAQAPALGLMGKKDREPEVGLDELERVGAGGETQLIDWLVQATGRSKSAVMKARAQRPVGLDAERLLAACANDHDLFDRVLPFAGLVRADHDGDPCVFLPQHIYVTERPGGRAFQSHYTPRSLTEPTVQYALEPVVYRGPAEGWDRADWVLRPPSELLSLKICDITCGSGAFLVAACRQLAALVVESWAQYPSDGGRPPELPSDPEEQQLVAQRFVAERCLYGVDKNPLAIDIAKVSLWLTTLRRGRPFTFVDHALRCGDSLIGVTDLEQVEFLSMDRHGAMLPDAVREGVAGAMARARELRRTIAATDPVDLPQVEAKQEQLAEFERLTAGLRTVADLVVFAQLASYGKKGTGPADLLVPYVASIRDVLADGSVPTSDLVAGAVNLRMASDAGERDPELRPFHWPLEFPEVFGEGFDVIVGNPPFLGAKRINSVLTANYREFLVDEVAGGGRGNADLVAYFLLRAHRLVDVTGTLGMVTTNTIAEGDSREVGLDYLMRCGGRVFRAVRTARWPGEASLEITHIWVTRRAWNGIVNLDGKTVREIGPYLRVPARVQDRPAALSRSGDRFFIGSVLNGTGFILPPDEARLLIDRDERNAAVVKPLVGGEDLQGRPDQSPARWVIDFADRSLDEVRGFAEPFRIVEERVKPRRLRLADGDATARGYAKKWWQFGRRAVALYQAQSQRPLAFSRSLVSNSHTMVAVRTGLVFAHSAGVFVADDWGEFSVIQSALHEVWIWRQASSMRTDIRYTPSDCFETFPFPPALPPGETGRALHDYRAERTRARNEGLTALTNRINDPKQNDEDIVRLRELMARMDAEVAAAYGWEDLTLDHGFHETRIGRRFTICEAAREEVIDRLLELNHKRYADEVAQGLHEKKSGKGKGKAKPATQPAQQSLLGDDGGQTL